MADKVNMIIIKSARDDDRVALWEKHPDHPAPSHEIFVSGDAEVEAAETARTLRAIADGDVVKVEDKKASASKASGSK